MLTVKNTVMGDLGPVRVFDADGVELHNLVEAEVETGRVVRHRTLKGHPEVKVYDAVTGEAEREELHVSAPLRYERVFP